MALPAAEFVEMFRRKREVSIFIDVGNFTSRLA
jgi:hypothetical protein